MPTRVPRQFPAVILEDLEENCRRVAQASKVEM